MQTVSGKKFYPLNPRVEDVDIYDIAHHLGNLCRYNGATKSFYSVAQHSVLVSTVCDPRDALWGLLHDASEAYMGDMIRPLKHSPGYKQFRKDEARCMAAVCKAFDLLPDEPSSVHWADAAMLATEKRDMLARPQEDMDETAWLHGAPASDALQMKLRGWTPTRSRDSFIGRYHQLLSREPASLWRT
jgi:hypothetical protein